METRNDAVVVGYDAMTPLGFTLEETWKNAEAGRSGVRGITRFPLSRDYPVRVAGEVPDLDFSRFPFWNERDQANWFSPVIFGAMAVVHRALAMAGLELGEQDKPRTAVVFSSAIGGLDAMIDAEKRHASGRTPHPFTNPNGCLNLVAGKVSMMTGATGPCFSPVAACATGNVSIALGSQLLGLGLAEIAICGAVDFPVLPSLVASFAAMNGAFQSQRTDDRAATDPALASRPFSRDRKGFVLSEGSAALILASAEAAKSRGLRRLGTIRGVGMNGDASHYVQPHEPTITRCMALALEDAGIEPEDIDYVSAHAASTRLGDLVESRAIHAIFGAKTPPVGALKSQLGHTMGASSAIEAVLAIEGMRRGIALPTIHLDSDPEIDINHVANEAARIDQELVLSNSFGFGGANCCIVFERGES